MLEFKHISKSFQNKKILDDLSFTVQAGEITYLIGENGSGKTTLMNLAMKLIPLDQGEITLDGQEISFQDFNRINYIPDQSITLKSMTILQALHYMDRYYTSFNWQKASEMLEFFHLNPTDSIAKLSKGNVAKVNILLGLALDTDFLLMDEPFSGIDILTRQEITSVFSSKLLENQGVLISSHDVHDLEYMVDKAIVLHQGKIVKEFRPEEEREESGRGIIDVMREEFAK